MKLISFLIPLTTLFTSASSVLVQYDPIYDDSATLMDAVACSDGKYGLMTKGYKTFGSLPSFPHIGAASAVEGWDSTSCGSCWELSYTKSDKTTNKIYVTAIDHAADGFLISPTALTHLAGQQAVGAGKIDAKARRVARSYCGFKS